jgi:putative hydrolase of the HAD superfamily
MVSMMLMGIRWVHAKRSFKGVFMIDVVLFDVDGVLVNGKSFSFYLERDYGITTDMASAFFRHKFVPCLIGEADLKVEISDYLQPWGWTKSVDELLDYWFTCEHIIDQSLIDYVQQLRQRDIHCYLATQQEKYRTAYLLDQMGFAHTFDGIFSSAYIGKLKDNPAFFTHILQDLHVVDGHTVLFWDDSSRNVQVARQAGLCAEVYAGFTNFQSTMSQYGL